MTPEQIVDLDRIEKFLARGRRHASNFWNINDDGYCMASVLDAAPAMVAELRALRAESAQLARLRERLERLRPLEAAATPGPWAWEMEDSTCLALYGPEGAYHHVLWSQICPSCAGRGDRCTAANKMDQDFIAAARNEIAAMLEELKP